MKTLALEFSSAHRSVAALLDGETRGLATETASRAGHPITLIQQALAAAGWEREEIGALVVGLGPGSYTGIRSAISVAQGWQLAREIKLLGLSSAATLAEQARESGWFGVVSVVIDAQRHEVYLAQYHVGEGGVNLLEPLRLAAAAEVERRVEAGDLVIGPEATRWTPAGRNLAPSATTLARLAAAATHFVNGEELSPIYLRETTFVKAPPSRVLPSD